MLEAVRLLFSETMFFCGPLPFGMADGLMNIYTFQLKSEHKFQ
jgi:hypothetical protein